MRGLRRCMCSRLHQEAMLLGMARSKFTKAYSKTSLMPPYCLIYIIVTPPFCSSHLQKIEMTPYNQDTSLLQPVCSVLRGGGLPLYTGSEPLRVGGYVHIMQTDLGETGDVEGLP